MPAPRTAYGLWATTFGAGALLSLKVDWRLASLWGCSSLLLAMLMLSRSDPIARKPPRRNFLRALPVVTLLPVLGIVNIHRIFVIFPLALLMLLMWLMFTVRRFNARKAHAHELLLALLVLVSAISMTRGYKTDSTDTFSSMLFLLLVTMVILWSLDTFDAESLLVTLRLALSVFLGLNLLLFGLGVESQVLAGFVGGTPPGRGWSGLPRTVFPMAAGLNLFAATATFLLVIAMTSNGTTDRLSRSIRVSWLATDVIVSLAVLTMVGARVALVAALMIAVAAQWQNSYRILKWLGVGIALIPFWWSAALSTIGVDAATELTTLNGRKTIWDSVITTIGAMSAQEHLIGFGRYGQFTSGASTRYSHLFVSWVDSQLVSAHNGLAQAWLDGGLTMVAAVSAVVVMTFLWIGQRYTSSTRKTVAAVMVAALMISGFESGIVWTSRWSLAGVIVLVLLSMPLMPEEGESNFDAPPIPPSLNNA